MKKIPEDSYYQNGKARASKGVNLSGEYNDLQFLVQLAILFISADDIERAVHGVYLLFKECSCKICKSNTIVMIFAGKNPVRSIIL